MYENIVAISFVVISIAAISSLSDARNQVVVFLLTAPFSMLLGLFQPI